MWQFKTWNNHFQCIYTTISITLETDLIEVLLGRRFNILVITNKEDVQINAVPLDAARVCVCVCVCVWACLCGLWGHKFV